MNFLFVHQNYPGQFLHIIQHLAAAERHDVVAISEPNANVMAGVRRIAYSSPDRSADVHNTARELDSGVRRADAVFKVGTNLRTLGFRPDIIIGHHGWGELLNLRDLWPDVPMLGYLEFYYHHDQADIGYDPEFPVSVTDFPRIRAKNAINNIALTLGGTGQTPTRWQLSTYPEWARPQIELVWEGVNLDICSPDLTVMEKEIKFDNMTVYPGDKLVTYVARDLEPYRGFHIMMRALPDLMRAGRAIKVVIIGGDEVSYGAAPVQGGSWREVMMAEMGSGIDPGRVAFPGRIPHAAYISVLRRSDAHVYMTYPFVASWSLREALAIGCPIIASDNETVKEFITHGANGLLTPFTDPNALAHSILCLLDDDGLTRELRAGARAYAERHLAMADYLDSYCRLIERLTGEHPNPNG